MTDTSKVICNPDGCHVVAEVSGWVLPAVWTRAELDRRGVERVRVEEREQ